MCVGNRLSHGERQVVAVVVERYKSVFERVAKVVLDTVIKFAVAIPLFFEFVCEPVLIYHSAPIFPTLIEYRKYAVSKRVLDNAEVYVLVFKRERFDVDILPKPFIPRRLFKVRQLCNERACSAIDR